MAASIGHARGLSMPVTATVPKSHPGSRRFESGELHSTTRRQVAGFLLPEWVTLNAIRAFVAGKWQVRARPQLQKPEPGLPQVFPRGGVWEGCPHRAPAKGASLPRVVLLRKVALDRAADLSWMRVGEGATLEPDTTGGWRAAAEVASWLISEGLRH
jgi:hypothetical protein